MEQNSLTSRADYLIISFIGISFALFSIPILKNIEIPFLTLNFTTVLFLVVFFAIFANFALWIASLIGRWAPVAFQFAKFGAIGAFNTFLDWGVLNILIAITGIATGIGYSSFKGISFIIATISSYFWNKYWTFESKKSSTGDEVGKFLSVSFVGLLINIGMASLIVFSFQSSNVTSPERLANIGAGAATIVSLIWNFIGYKFWVFKK
ncbi:GtrA family protein [bacterium]|nr:GtrA family protein [bacterium]